MPVDGWVARVIRASLQARSLVLLLVALLVVVGAWTLTDTPIDALPDISDRQVIVQVVYEGQAPRIVEDQVTYPLSRELRAVPGATAVRGYSFFGESFIDVLFADGTDLYTARTLVLETLDPLLTRLPPGAHASMGPPATGVGWIYEYALVDRTGRHDLAQLRSLQDWFLRPELQSIPGVAEVATVGGMVKEYQVVLDPMRMQALGVSVAQVREAIENGSGESGGAAIELAETEYMIRTRGYVSRIEDLRQIPVVSPRDSVPITLGDVARVQVGPQMRRGIADLDGDGEVVGGVVVMRDGANARDTLGRVKQRLRELSASLPQGVQIVPTYDRSGLIHRAIRNLAGKLLEESIVVVLVCALFLMHARSGLVVLGVTLLGTLMALTLMRVQGITANIMSLGGIAIAIGVMVDAAIVMLENVHKKLEPGPVQGRERIDLIARACAELAPPVCAALLIIALSFLPILSLQGQDGRLFAPLAYTKTYCMLAATLLTVTLVPVLIAFLVDRPARVERDQPVNRACQAGYRPMLRWSLQRPWVMPGLALLLMLATLWPATRLGAEFLPAMDEGDLIYMPSTQPGIAPDVARQVLQRLDRSLRAVPEVQSVFGKAGRAETATDPAPLEMFEILVQLKPRAQWRAGLSVEDLKRELGEHARMPGLQGSWLPPIRSRIEMLTTSVRAPLGIRVAGPDLDTLQSIAERVADIVRGVSGVTSVYAEHPSAGHYIDIRIDRAAAGRVGLNVADINALVSTAIGGRVLGESVEGRERYPIVLRYPRESRDSLERLEQLALVTPRGDHVALGSIAHLAFADGPMMIRSEDGRPSVWVSIDFSGRDLSSVVGATQAKLAAAGVLPAGYSLQWTGEFEHLERSKRRFELIVPVTLLVIAALLYLTFRRWSDVLLILGVLPLALSGGLWLMWVLGLPMSVAAGVGFIALAGVAVETGIVMLVYLNSSWSQVLAADPQAQLGDLEEAIVAGALQRLRPKLMTVVTITAGLLPILVGQGTGAEVMRRMAVPMVGGMLSAALLTLLVIPSLYLLLHKRILAGAVHVAR